MSGEDTKKSIEVYVEEYRKSDTRTFMMLEANDIDVAILTDHFVRGRTIQQISRDYGISPGTVSGFIMDYRLTNYVDGDVEGMALLDAENHLGVMSMFFANAMFLSKEASMTSLLARKVREEIAKSMSERGGVETVKDRELMQAWDTVSRKTVDYAANAGKFMETYLKLMEKVLDKQRDMAFVKVMYDVIQKLDPQVAEELQTALHEDEYAKAVLSSMSGEALLKMFTERSRSNGMLSDAEYVDALLLSN